MSAVVLGPGALEVTWPEGVVSRFHYVWLRDNCRQLLHASTGHRVVETSSIPVDTAPSSATFTDGGDIRIVWAADGHESVFSEAWLRQHDYSNGASIERPQIVLWDASMIAEIPRASYPKLVDDAAVEIAFLDGFSRYGLGLLSDVSCEPGTVLNVARQFGELRTTSWGTVFDVISKEDANSVAYTNLPLVTHTDEGYRDPAPSVQLQHFLRADASGGASTLVDGFRIAEDIRQQRPDAFRLLSTTMHRFHFADSSAEHENFSTVIGLDGRGDVREIRYSNHSVTPFLMAFDQMDAYYDAYRLFGTMRESDEYQLRIPLGAGDLYMVDNRRVLHGRTGFSSGGARHLQSCYIERDELASRLTVLRRRQP